jgi:hypothetical protein
MREMGISHRTRSRLGKAAADATVTAISLYWTPLLGFLFASLAVLLIAFIAEITIEMPPEVGAPLSVVVVAANWTARIWRGRRPGSTGKD